MTWKGLVYRKAKQGCTDWVIANEDYNDHDDCDRDHDDYDDDYVGVDDVDGDDVDDVKDDVDGDDVDGVIVDVDGHRVESGVAVAEPECKGKPPTLDATRAENGWL